MKSIQQLLIVSFLLSLFTLKSQNAPEIGLENIIVEKYYISNANDTAGRLISGFLPIGSTTYRIYLDLLPEYRFYAAYGQANHELRIESTTKFFNNEEIGMKNPNIIPRRTYAHNTVMLDSWLTAGGAGEDYYGVLKVDDDIIETVIHEKQFLQNDDKSAGIPLRERDGLRTANKVPVPVLFGIDSATYVFFNSTNSPFFSTRNGAWGCLGGAVGIDSLTTNRVLIAQVTTNGDLSFELNVQIGKRGSAPALFVAKDPAEKEIILPFLTYHSKEPKVTVQKESKSSKKK